MSETMVGLEGPAESLAKLSSRFSSPQLTIIDEGNGAGYVKSSDFLSSADDASIIGVANRLVHRANSTMRLESSRFFQPVHVRATVVREDNEGKRTISIHASDYAVIGSMETASVVEHLPDGTTRLIVPSSLDPPQPPIGDIVLSLPLDDAVDDALRYFAYQANWAINLYKVYEIVGLYVEETKRGRKSTLSDNKERFIQRGWDEIAKQGWVTRDAIDRFTRTVHSSEVLGEQARHAVQTRPVPADPMNEDEAKKFIGTVLDKWLRQKHDERSQGQLS